MPRIARIVIPGLPHHVTQRGNRGEDVFLSDSDRRLYLDLLGHYAAQEGLKVHAYCLMSNHVHLIAVPERAGSLCAALKPVHLRYAQEFNRRTGQRGILWQGRFYSCPLDERHMWAAIRYVERNPVRARLVRKAQRYAWSSAAAHCGRKRDELLSGDLDECKPVDDWSGWLAAGEDEEEMTALRSATCTGRPAGTEEFVKRLEKLVGRRLRSLGRGRPRASTKNG